MDGFFRHLLIGLDTFLILGDFSCTKPHRKRVAASFNRRLCLRDYVLYIDGAM